PFGLKHHGYNADHQVYEASPGDGQVELVPVIHWEDDPYHYQYNSKEFQEELGLHWYDYGARNSCPERSRRDMPDFARWTTVDPLAGDYPGWCPYNYTLLNPVTSVDPEGRSVVLPLDRYKSDNKENITFYDKKGCDAVDYLMNENGDEIKITNADLLPQLQGKKDDFASGVSYKDAINYKHFRKANQDYDLGYAWNNLFKMDKSRQ